MHDDNPGLWVTIKDIEERERQEAAARAEGRADWYVMVHGAKAILGPVSEAKARQGVIDALRAGQKPKLLRVVEDYEA